MAPRALTPIFNQAAASWRSLSRFATKGRKVISSMFFSEQPAPAPPKIIPATPPRLRSRWKTKHFFKMLKP